MNAFDWLAFAQQHLVIQQAFAQLSADLIILDSTPNLETLIHLPLDEVVGQPLTEVFYEFAGVESELLAILAGAAAYKLERINRVSPAGEILYFDFEIAPLGAHSSEPGLLLIVTDMTAFGRLEQSLVQERNELRLAEQRLARANQELRRLDRLKSIFLSMAAHDLRAPVTIIRGYTELLLQAVSDPADDMWQRLQTVRLQAEWLDNTINNVLDLDQIENDRLRLHCVPCFLDAICQDMVALLQPMAILNEQTLTLRLPEEPILVNASPPRLRQILQNLLGNAIKYTPSGGHIEVALSAEPTRAHLAVSDNGQGISPEARMHLFELYYRAGDESSRSVGGTGLGLYIVKVLVEAHGGSVSVNSARGQGTTFTVSLPRLKAPLAT